MPRAPHNVTLVQRLFTYVFSVSLFTFALGTSSSYAQNQSVSPYLGRVSADKSRVLTCAETRKVIGLFLENHFVFKEFNDELSRRSLAKIFQVIDPGKYYFLKSDIESFKPLENQLDDLVTKLDCRFIADIHGVFKKRLDERQEAILKLLSQPFDFTKDESILVDRRKEDWGKDNKDLDERWRKRIKFQVLSLKEVGGEAKARERLRKRYVQMKKRFDEQNSDEAFGHFLNAFAQALDPHSSYMLPVEQDEFTVRLSNQFEGIGATLMEEDGYIIVANLIPGGAAHRDGRLKAQDKIIAVDPGDGSGFQDLIDMEVSKAVRFIRGKKGTTVTLLVLRKSNEPGKSEAERQTIKIVRDAVQVTGSEAKSDVIDVRNKKIGVLRLPVFYTDFACRTRAFADCQGAAAHVLREIRRLEKLKIDGLLLDLRSNGGGDLMESILMTGLFIPKGTVVQTVDRRRVVKGLPDPDGGVAYPGPMAVLINKESASASEIVSGALQDYGRAIIIGNKSTYGKATVQGVQDLQGTSGRKTDGAIKVTQSKFYRPSGRSNQARGVEADVVLPNVLDDAEIGEMENDYVLQPDSIRPAPDFKPLVNLSEIIKKVQILSAQRIQKNKDYIELKEKIEKFKTEKEKNVASLKEEKKERTDKKTSSQKGKGTKKKEDGGLEDPTATENVVIRADDYELREAAFVLADSLE